MKTPKFEDLFAEGLQELYDAENQILKVLPKMIAAASSGGLARNLQGHLDQTRVHLARLHAVFEAMGVTPGGGQSLAMENLLNEADRRINELGKSPVLDIALIDVAQKAEFHEIATYRTARSLAESLGQPDAAGSLQETLDEEEDAVEDLADLAESVLTGENTSQGMSGA